MLSPALPACLAPSLTTMEGLRAAIEGAKYGQ